MPLPFSHAFLSKLYPISNTLLLGLNVLNLTFCNRVGSKKAGLMDEYYDDGDDYYDDYGDEYYDE